MQYLNILVLEISTTWLIKMKFILRVLGENSIKNKLISLPEYSHIRSSHFCYMFKWRRKRNDFNVNCVGISLAHMFMYLLFKLQSLRDYRLHVYKHSFFYFAFFFFLIFVKLRRLKSV